MRARLGRTLGHPLLHFALLGSFLFALERGLSASASEGSFVPIAISAERMQALRQRSVDLVGTPASPSALAALIRSEVDDELLLRRARALGLDRDDPVIRRRLAANLRFAGADPARDDDALFEEALALGMDRTDVVVRRRLLQRMRRLIEASADGQEPSEDALRAYLEAHAERFAQPARVRITQIYFEPERLDEVQRLGERWQAEGQGPEVADRHGDAFLYPARQPAQSRSQLAARFGASFAREILELETGVWSGPIASPYGVHLVWVHERTASRPAALDEVREAVRHALRAERRRAVLRDTLQAWRAEVEVRVEDGPAS